MGEINDTIDLVIFDLGGVILNIDYTLTQRAFAQVGVQNVDELYSQARQSDLFDALEMGEISPKEFRRRLNALIPNPIEPEELDEAWNALLLDLPVKRLHFISAVKERFKTCVLSNTNSIHINAFESKIRETIGIKVYKDAFDAIFYSSVIGRRKPDQGAFHYVLEHFGVAADQVLFIDDSEQHVVAAKAMGIEAVLLKKGEEVDEVLSYLIS